MSCWMHPRIDLEDLDESGRYEVLGHYTWDVQLPTSQQAHTVQSSNEESSVNKHFLDFATDGSSHGTRCPIVRLEPARHKNEYTENFASAVENLTEDAALAVYLTRKGQSVDASIR